MLLTFEETKRRHKQWKQSASACIKQGVQPPPPPKFGKCINCGSWFEIIGRMQNKGKVFCTNVCGNDYRRKNDKNHRIKKWKREAIMRIHKLQMPSDPPPE